MSATESFFSLTPERVLAAAEVAGRRATGYAFPLNSLENRVYEIELEDESRVVGKFYRPGRWSRAAILEEHAFLAELAAAEVPVVPPLDLGGGETLRESEGPILYALFPKVRGRVPEEPDEVQLSVLGRLVARLHNVGARRAAPDRPILTAESYAGDALQVLLSGSFVPLELERSVRETGEAILDACGEALDGVPAIRLHGDCHRGNLLWGSEGPFFLDFDDCLSGPTVQDLWLLVPGRDEAARAERETLVSAYEQMRDFDRRTLRLIEPLRTLRIVRYAGWIVRRWKDPALQRAFPEFREHDYWRRELAVWREQLGLITHPGQ